MADRFKTFLDSSIDQSFDDVFQEDANDALSQSRLRRPGRDGQRTVPGDEGFMFADSPSSTIYVRKKQWRDETWTYTVAENERAGKLKEVAARKYLGRIVTRKIDWMASHEKFSKTKEAIDTLSDFFPSLFSQKTTQSAQRETEEFLANVFDSLTDVRTALNLEFAPVGLSGASYTRYYTGGDQVEDERDFNGLMELANVYNITTNISIDGEGSATITLENPQNIFYISENDIDIALGEDPYLESPNDGQPSTIQIDPSGELYYYRGRYYTREAFKLVSGVSPENFDLVAVDVDRPVNVSERRQVKQIMQKFFQNKYVFEVFDHMYIWLSSPSRTKYNLDRTEERPVMDADVGSTLGDLQLVRSEIIQVKAEIEELKAQIQGTPSGSVVDNAVNAASNAVSNLVGSVTNQITGGSASDSLNGQLTEANKRLADLEELEEGLEKEIETQSTDANRTDDGSRIISDAEFRSNRFAGFQEQQYQVFEGLITNVTNRFSDGKYTLTLQCRDVMLFLELSRIMIKPGLRGTSSEAPKGFLENPIWRETDKNNPFKEPGRWKSGLYVTADNTLFDRVASIVDRKKAAVNTPTIQDTAARKSLSTARSDYGVLLTQEPFARIDAANVISFLITGIPYNLKTFIKNATEFGRLYTPTPETGELADLQGYFAILKRQITSQNARLGDFEPFTPPELLPEEAKEVVQQAEVATQNAQTQFQNAIKGTPQESFFNDYKSKLGTAETPRSILNPQTGVASPESILNDYQYDLFSTWNRKFRELQTAESTRAIAEEFANQKRQNQQQTGEQRTPDLNKSKELIIKNTDKNYLVVSSEYSKNLEIQAFNTLLANAGDWSLWQSEYDIPKNVALRAAQQVDFEFYADSQGNLQFKPPTYNRVLKSHVKDITQVEEIYRDAFLKKFTDDVDFVEAGDTIADVGGKFALSDARFRILQVKLSGQQDAVEYVQGDLDALNRRTNNRYANEVRSKKGVKIPSIEISESTSIQALQSQLETIEGRINSAVTSVAASSTDKQQLLRLKTELESRKNFVRELESKMIEAQQLRNEQRERATSAFNQLARFTDEDRIHVLRDSDILSYELSESPPDYTRLDVTGLPEFVNLASSAETYYWSGGVDFDLWRNYGYLFEQFNKSYFHDGQSCKTYCEALLGRQWAKVLSGSVSIRGDSKYRLGDCVFIEGLKMYYYVVGISHSITFAQGYQTGLVLAYGRRPGQYIPHPFDIIGNQLISTVEKLNTENAVSARQSLSGTKQSTSTTKKETAAAVSTKQSSKNPTVETPTAAEQKLDLTTTPADTTSVEPDSTNVDISDIDTSSDQNLDDIFGTGVTVE